MAGQGRRPTAPTLVPFSLAMIAATLCPPELKVRTPAHTKHQGWHLEFEFRVTHRPVSSSRLHCRPTAARSEGERPALALCDASTVQLQAFVTSAKSAGAAETRSVSAAAARDIPGWAGKDKCLQW